MNIKTKIPVVLALLLVALLSMTKITSWATNLETHEHTIAELDDKINTVMELTAGATASSAALSFLPDDQCTPIAQEIAELAKYFLIVLSALYLEKYMITVSGYVAFKVIIPIACVCLGVGIFAKKDAFSILSAKLAVCALAVFLMVPSSVMVSDMIYANYANSIDATIDTAMEVSIDDTDSGIMEQLVSWLTEAAGKARDYVAGLLSHFMEALAVMIVTSCVVPLLVILLYLWFIKQIFGIDLYTKMPNVFKKRI